MAKAQGFHRSIKSTSRGGNYLVVKLLLLSIYRDGIVFSPRALIEENRVTLLHEISLWRPAAFGWCCVTVVRKGWHSAGTLSLSGRALSQCYRLQLKAATSAKFNCFKRCKQRGNILDVPICSCAA